MNKQIKFRALDKVLGLWEKRHCVLSMEGHLQIYNSQTGNYFQPNIEDYEIMQFVGLLDKNGKEIYQHDWLDGIYEGYIDWCDKCKQFQLHWPDFGCANCSGDINWSELVNDPNLEVIDNIQSNPNLFYRTERR